jgi:hypothetical protein
VTPHLEVLPPAQRAFWYRIANGVPESFVLYGGTAVALRYGHRHSVDFDYFSDRPLDREHLVESLPAIRAGEVLQQSKETLTARIFIDGQPVKLSFFGEIGFGRVGQPDVIDHRVIASPIDLLATKLKTLHDRIEAKDYLDIEALLKAGLTSGYRGGGRAVRTQPQHAGYGKGYCVVQGRRFGQVTAGGDSGVFDTSVYDVRSSHCAGPHPVALTLSGRPWRRHSSPRGAGLGVCSAARRHSSVTTRFRL